MDLNLKGKVALVTGAAQGLGNVISTSLVKEGAAVAMADVSDSVEKAAAALKAEGHKVFAVKMDISNYQQVVDGFQKSVQALGPIDILVNNAAVTGKFATTAKMDPANWDREVAIDLSGAFYCSHQVIDSMTQKGFGRIINIISPAGPHGGYGQCSYSASKSGLIGLTRSIAIETARNGITCNAVMPGLMPTPGYYALKEDVRERLLKHIASRKLCDPQYVADLVLFLVSEKASYLTGEVYSAAGGEELQIY